MCYAGAQKEGQSCNFYQGLDMESEGRGARKDVSHTVSLPVQRPSPAYSVLTGALSAK